MNDKMNLKEIEKRAWKSYFQDGLFDILLGLLLLSFAFFPFLEQIGVPYLLNYLIAFSPAYVIFFAGKKYITVPRLGRAKFSAERRSKKKKTRIVLTISVVFGLIVFLSTVANIFPLKSNIHFGAVAFGANAIIVFSLMAYFLDFNRLYLYGWFFAASIFLVESSRSIVGSTYDNVIGFGLFGIIMIFIGAVYFIRFLRKYPRPIEATSYGKTEVYM